MQRQAKGSADNATGYSAMSGDLEAQPSPICKESYGHRLNNEINLDGSARRNNSDVRGRSNISRPRHGVTIHPRFEPWTQHEKETNVDMIIGGRACMKIPLLGDLRKIGAMKPLSR